MKGHTLSKFEVEARCFSVGHTFRHLILILSKKKKKKKRNRSRILPSGRSRVRRLPNLHTSQRVPAVTEIRRVCASMPRGRWVFDEDLSRAMWQQILRGPRPPSVWPRSHVNVNQQQRSGGRQPHRCRWQSSGIRQHVQPTETSVRENTRRGCSCQPGPHRKNWRRPSRSSGRRVLKHKT